VRFLCKLLNSSICQKCGEVVFWLSFDVVLSDLSVYVVVSGSSVDAVVPFDVVVSGSSRDA
jgi:hypothetical protein